MGVPLHFHLASSIGRSYIEVSLKLQVHQVRLRIVQVRRSIALVGLVGEC